MPEARDDLAAEINRLLTAVQDWARRFPQTQPEDAHGAGRECLAWCPICQFANLLRGEHPEVTDRLTEAANAIAAAMKALADAAVTRSQPDGARARPSPAPRVEHIRIHDPAEPE